VVNAVALVCGSVPAAEDAVQEALLRGWMRSSRGEQIDRPAAWVVTVALNLARTGIRRRLAERRARERLVADQRSTEPSGDRTDVRRALALLPRRQREVAVLRYFLELPTREVALVLGIGEGTVKSSLARARASLATALQVAEVDANDE
jgi:RNA polymerase sigma-70 factor (ECF subfamily)